MRSFGSALAIFATSPMKCCVSAGSSFWPVGRHHVVVGRRDRRRDRDLEFDVGRNLAGLLQPLEHAPRFDRHRRHSRCRTSPDRCVAPGLTRSRGISRTSLPSHCTNLNGGTSLANSIAGLPDSTSCRNLIQVLRMPVSPSGRRMRCGPTAFDSVRNTVSLSGSGMLPTKCTIGCLLRSVIVARPCSAIRQIFRRPHLGVDRRLDLVLGEIGQAFLAGLQGRRPRHRDRDLAAAP